MTVLWIVFSKESLQTVLKLLNEDSNVSSPHSLKAAGGASDISVKNASKSVDIISSEGCIRIDKPFMIVLTTLRRWSNHSWKHFKSASKAKWWKSNTSAEAGKQPRMKELSVFSTCSASFLANVFFPSIFAVQARTVGSHASYFAPTDFRKMVCNSWKRAFCSSIAAALALAKRWDI